MSASENASAEKKPAAASPFTPREVEVMQAAWGCLKTVPDVDYHKLAEAMGVGSHRSAANAWCAVKKKLVALMPAAADEDGNLIATPKRKRATPAKKKAAAPAPAGDGDEDELTTETENKLVVRTPKQVKLTPKKKAAAAAAATAADGEDEEQAVPETPAKKCIRTPKKLDKSKLLKPEVVAAQAAAAAGTAGKAKFELKQEEAETKDVAMEDVKAEEGNAEI
ncbi:hypothetical protein CPLU01_08474 [Colletotrichum plurivorum]|uniref:Uncharacterized protein n=1 Tax=Colletotrichum plurivorum TaxID=2175906 RepID=A0A8H6KB86_9PEZI|nr:hypothetical protein CPLU01_08474 [Colletotrichum plurivorum]